MYKDIERVSEGTAMLEIDVPPKLPWESTARNPFAANIRARWDDLQQNSSRRTLIRDVLVLIVLIASLSCNLWYLLHQNTALSHSSGKGRSLVGLVERPTVTRKNGFYTREYDVELSGKPEVDALWNNVTEGFGIVALDRELALSHGLEPSRAWKLDRSKSVYVFATYHVLHCVHSLRLAYNKMASGETPTDYWRYHGDHCFESLREEIMCRATDRLLATKLDETRKDTLRIGEDEDRQCADWEYLRDWAGAHTAGWTYDTETGSDPGFFENGLTHDGYYVPPALR